jgi:membrane fusion protein (multidrug efflux system)
MTKNQPNHDRPSADPDHPGGITALLEKPNEDVPPQKKFAEDKKGQENNKEQEDKGDEKKELKEKHDAEESKEEKEGDKEKKPDKPPVYKRPAVIISISAFLIIVIIGGIAYWLHARHYVSTDDAYIDGHVTQISPQIPARALKLHITDNQFVHEGDLLIELDPTDYQVALEQANAQALAAQGRLAQAEAQIDAAKAAVSQANAEVEAAQVALHNTTSDLKRFQEVDERARSRQQLDNAVAAQKNAQAQLEQTKARKTSTEVNVTTAQAAVKAAEGELRTAQANVKRAEVNLGYCQIRAPCSGRVTQRTVEAGAYLQTGQAMFALVDPDVWVTANFKETQLKNMKPGQPVTIKVDAFGGTKFEGHVDSIQAGSGSRFSILPPENATGNFVKVVQRVPVKIIFNHGVNTNDEMLLSPGLSVTPKVKVL